MTAHLQLDEMRDLLRRHSVLENDAGLDALARDLLVVSEAYRGQSSTEEAEEVERAERWYADVVKSYEALIALAEKRPIGAFLGGPDMRELQVQLMKAQADVQLFVDKRPAHRPATHDRRDWLAREVARTLKRHAPRLKGEARLRAIAAVMDHAGASYPELENNRSKFRTMLKEQHDAHMAEWRRMQRAEAVRGRLDGVVF